MSAFSDFQKAWAQRFPNSDLPQAWEDDVRANLSKHRQKVTTLKEELEKAEFYVEYLECLLADVKRVKNRPSPNESNPDSEKRRSQLCHGLDAPRGIVRSKEALSDDKNEDGNDENLSADVENSCSPNIEECNSYVTVIEVGGSTPPVSLSNDKNGLPSPSLEHVPVCQTESSETESPPSSLQAKKKPPAPPKKPRKAIPVQAVPPVKKACDAPESLSENTQIEKENNLDDNFKKDNLVQKLDNLVNNLSNDLDSEKFIEICQEPEPVKTNFEEQPSSVEENCKDNEKNSTETTEYDETNNYEEENIYDTVASDDTSLSNEDNSNQCCESAETSKISREDSGDYVMFSEAYEMAQDAAKPVLPSLPMRQMSTQKSVDDEESPEYATYMNIDYFLKNKGVLPSQAESIGGDSEDEEPYLIRSFSSDQEIEAPVTDDKTSKSTNAISNTNDDVFEIDSGVYSSSVESTSYLGGQSAQPASVKKHETDKEDLKGEIERTTMYKCILNSIIESEAVYVECLNMLLQYMKALRSTIGTSQPLLSLEDFNVIFYRIPELHSLHQTFLQGLKKQIENWNGSQAIGESFKILASKLGVYGSFLQNYSRAIETVRKCSIDNSKFSEITKSIKLKALQGQSTNLEDLLHKPVARVQKNALVLHDILRYTPDSHADYKTLKMALKMTQCFLQDINVSATESMFPITDRAQRHLVKNSFIVELSENHRKLRHLFLFSDVIVCAKYKPATRQKFTFEVKWFIPLSEVLLPNKTSDGDSIKENSPFDILSLKSRASNVRDQILKEEKGCPGKERTRVSCRNIDKHKKKLAELEAQLVLASPNLVFRVSQKMGKTFIFFLSSEFEKAQWIEAISILQTSAPASALPISPYELQAWITTCRKHFGTNLGSFLLRSGKDEDLLLGDLYIIVHKLHGLNRPSDVYLCFEVDSYGHFFNKAKTKLCCNSLEPNFEQDFIIELEGSQTLRILCYENLPEEGAVLRGKGALELSRSWLNEKVQEKSVSLQDLMLTMSLKYEPPELSLRRIPSSKSGGVFGVKIQQVCKKEKTTVPFIMISCIREVEKRGIHEVGIYRVSGSASDVQRLKKSFETNIYEAEQLLKEVDIHSVTGLFKMYLRELPEALFTDSLYQKFFLAFSMGDQETKKKQLLQLFDELPEINQGIIQYLLDHMLRINHHESTNKMSLHNLATVFGPTLLRPGSRSSSSSAADLLTAGTVDVMAQAGIFYFFLKRRAAGLTLRPEL